MLALLLNYNIFLFIYIFITCVVNLVTIKRVGEPGILRHRPIDLVLIAVFCIFCHLLSAFVLFVETNIILLLIWVSFFESHLTHGLNIFKEFLIGPCEYGRYSPLFAQLARVRHSRLRPANDK